MQFLKSILMPSTNNNYISRTIDILKVYLQEVSPPVGEKESIVDETPEIPPILLSQYSQYSRSSPCPVFGDELPKVSLNTIIRVVNQDCLDVAREAYCRTAQKVSILNCANSYNCGGGFDRCNGSQEEYLFRNTTLLASLWPHRRVDDSRLPEVDSLLPRSTNSYYPISEAGGIYSPHVVVHSVMDTALSSDEFFPCSVLTIAAQDLRLLRGNETFDFELTRQKFRTLLHMAQANGDKILVLTSIGCGAFLNDPVEVARAFQSLLCDGGEFYGVFEEVFFAVIKSARNLEIFQNAFPTKL
jgi:uncharacterized protein (TIGR02452 family)